MTKALLLLIVLTAAVSAQQPAAQSGAQPSTVTYTVYSAQTELFAEWRPFVVGQATRLTSHLAHTGERFRAFEEGKVTLTFTVGDVKVSAIADAPERAGVFRLNVTPTRGGVGRMVMDVATDVGTERFTVNDVPVYATVAGFVAAAKPAEAGLISFAKEQSWSEDFATAPVTWRYQGRMLLVPSTAVVRDGTRTSIYVQPTPKRFEFRQVAVGQTFGNLVRSRTDFVIATMSSFAVLTRCPDNEASMSESDWCASGSLDRIVCDNQRGSAKDDRDRDNND